MPRGYFFYSKKSLCLFGSANGASAFARTAFETSVSVDFVNAVIFCDCANRASICARTATDASIFVNLVCHNRNSVLDGNRNMLCQGTQPPLNTITLIFYHIFLKSQIYNANIFKKN